MKSKFLFIAIIAILFAFCFYACTKSNDVLDVSKEHQRIGENSDYANEEFTDVSSYLEAHRELFGYPLIFDSFEEAENTINALNDMDYLELQDWCSNSNFSSTQLRALIIYDSLFYDLQNTLLGKEIETLEEENYIYDELYNIVTQPEYNNLFSSYNKFDSVTNTTEQFIVPIGTFHYDPYSILANDKNIFIVGTRVFYYIEGTLLSTEIPNFYKISTFSSMNQLETAISSGDGITEEEVEIYRCWSFFQGKKVNIEYSQPINGKYCIVLNLHTRVYTALNLRLGGGFKITNYKYTNNKWIKYRSRINYSIHFAAKDRDSQLVKPFNFNGGTRWKVKSVSKCFSYPITIAPINLSIINVIANISNNKVTFVLP